jgi:hypothetical protein
MFANHTYTIFFSPFKMIRAAIPKHPFEVLCYATKHGYADMMDAAVIHATGMSLEQAHSNLTPSMYIAWVRNSMIYLGV